MKLAELRNRPLATTARERAWNAQAHRIYRELKGEAGWPEHEHHDIADCVRRYRGKNEESLTTKG